MHPTGFPLRERHPTTPPPPKAVLGSGSKVVVQVLEFVKYLQSTVQKELEKLHRLCIISNVTYYRNGARGGRLGARVLIRSGAAPWIRTPARALRDCGRELGPAGCSWERGREIPGRHPSLHLPPLWPILCLNLQIAWVNWMQKRYWQKWFLFFFFKFSGTTPTP